MDKELNGQNLKDTGYKQEKERRENGTYKPGVSGNPDGRPKDSKNFKTLFDEALRAFAKDTGQEPDEIEKKIIMKGITEAMKGNYNFWRDIQDRLFGKPSGSLDVTSAGEKIGGNVIEFVDFSDKEKNKPFEDEAEAQPSI